MSGRCYQTPLQIYMKSCDIFPICSVNKTNVNIICLLMLQNVREQLEESLPGTGGGKNSNDELLVKFLFLLHFFALLFFLLSFFPSGQWLRIIMLFLNQCLDDCCLVPKPYYFLVLTGGSLCRTSLCNLINADSQVSFPSSFLS